MDDISADLEAGNALMQACAGGDRQAFHQLYLNEAPRMLAFARRFTGESACADDALQDTFVQVWKNAHRFRHERGSENLLHRPICNQTIYKNQNYCLTTYH